MNPKCPVGEKTASIMLIFLHIFPLSINGSATHISILLTLPKWGPLRNRWAPVCAQHIGRALPFHSAKNHDFSGRDVQFEPFSFQFYL